MEIKAMIVVMSHLSDVQEQMRFGTNESVNERINFAKYIILQTNGDLNAEIDPDEMYENFKNK